MPLQIAPISAHPPGEEVLPTGRPPLGPPAVVPPVSLPVDTFSGRVYVEWDPQAPVTPLGQLVFFTQFLKTAGLFEPWVEDCPLQYTSPNAPSKSDVLGTQLLSILAGHKRYAHITALRGDTVNPPLLGMKQVVSEDAIRRAGMKLAHEVEPLELSSSSGGVALHPEPAAGAPTRTNGATVAWQQKHLRQSYEPLLYEPWILDIDTTIKTVYGHQGGAEVGYNPHKRGRPSHTYHSYLMGAARLVLDVEVRPGNQSAACYSRPGLWKLFDAMPVEGRPWLLRGDCLFGNEDTMAEAETRHLRYLFKLRLTKKPKELIQQLERTGQWVEAGQGWEGIESQLQLHGWSRKRRVIVLRRRLKSALPPVPGGPGAQLLLDWKGLFPVQGPNYEYAVLVTSLTEEILTLAQLYRDRADAENNFDELKNQWGWAGFTTQDLERCQLAARTIALIYNWWSLFVRLADPSKRREAITSRPLLLAAVARQTTHAGQTTLVVTTSHGEATKIQSLLTQLSQFLTGLLEAAEQLTQAERWHRILSRIFTKVLNGRPLAAPQRALAGA